MRTAKRVFHVVILFACLVCMSRTSWTAEPAMDKLLPVPACADGWVLDGKVTLYDKDSLFDRINGESELYFPYGFGALAYGRYESNKDPQRALDVDVYAMGSPLDAFGIFASYRRKDDAAAVVGVEGTLSASQLLFYQDRYFVRLQVTGATSIDNAVLLACGRAVGKNLPRVAARPKELDAFALPGIVPQTERYIASSLLGYEFFRKGIIADAKLGKEEAQVFLIGEQSAAKAASVLEQYRVYLKAGGGPFLEGTDPLYGAVVAQQSGRFVAGAVRVPDRAAAQKLVQQVLERANRQERISQSGGSR